MCHALWVCQSVTHSATTRAAVCRAQAASVAEQVRLLTDANSSSEDQRAQLGAQLVQLQVRLAGVGVCCAAASWGF